MTRDDDFIGHLESYLEEYEGSTPLPEDVRDAVRAGLPSTRQLRFTAINQAMLIVVASAAVVTVALLGINFIRGPNVSGPGLGDPTPTAVPTSSPGSMSVAVPAALAPGRYVAGDPFSLEVSFTVPAGWEGRIAGPYLVDVGWVDKPGGISFSIFDLVSADPCHLMDQGYLDPPPGPSVDDLVTALVNMPGIEVTGLADVTVDGYSGTQLTISAPDNFAGCTLPSDGYVIWRLPLDSTHSMAPGERDRVWILDINGARLVIVIPEPPGYTDEQRAEAQAVFDSIQIAGP